MLKNSYTLVKLKMLGLTIPIPTSTFPQDFPQFIFQQGGLCSP